MRIALALLLLVVAAPVAWAGASVAPEHCFGATGIGCGAAGQPAYCRPALGSGELECMVSAGSIEHDSCCFRHPGGAGCGGQPATADCGFEWARAQQRVIQGLYWLRRVDPQQANRSGRVEFQTYCAPAGSVIAAGDERYCCNRAAVALDERDLQGSNKLRCR